MNGFLLVLCPDAGRKEGGYEATLPRADCRQFPPPMWTCRLESPCAASCSRSAIYMSAYAVSSEVDEKMIYSKKNLKLPIDPHGAS